MPSVATPAAIDPCLRASAGAPARAGVAGCGLRWRAAAAQLPGDRRDAWLKPFRAIEDTPVPLAVLACRLHVARQRGRRCDAARFAAAAAARDQRAARAWQRLRA